MKLNKYLLLTMVAVGMCTACSKNDAKVGTEQAVTTEKAEETEKAENITEETEVSTGEETENVSDGWVEISVTDIEDLIKASKDAYDNGNYTYTYTIFEPDSETYSTGISLRIASKEPRKIIEYSLTENEVLDKFNENIYLVDENSSKESYTWTESSEGEFVTEAIGNNIVSLTLNEFFAYLEDADGTYYKVDNEDGTFDIIQSLYNTDTDVLWHKYSFDANGLHTSSEVYNKTGNPGDEYYLEFTETLEVNYDSNIDYEFPEHVNKKIIGFFGE